MACELTHIFRGSFEPRMKRARLSNYLIPRPFQLMPYILYQYQNALFICKTGHRVSDQFFSYLESNDLTREALESSSNIRGFLRNLLFELGSSGGGFVFFKGSSFLRNLLFKICNSGGPRGGRRFRIFQGQLEILLRSLNVLQTQANRQ